MTTDLERRLDAAYKAFPTAAEWMEKTSVTDTRWDRYRQELDSHSKESAEALRRARQIAQRAAAFDTGAIEGLYETDRGFTYSVAFETGAWQAGMEARGEDVRPLFEAQLHAYESLLDLATNAEHLSEAAIRALHQQMVAAQETYIVQTPAGPQRHLLSKGRYKIHPNHVRTRDGVDHAYAPVEIAPMEMQRFVGELHTEVFLNAHPAQQMAYAHFAFVTIHPFADGNGRVARALASIYSLRALSLPLVLLAEQKDQYLHSLESADRGNFQSFVDFILGAELDTMRLVYEVTQIPGTPLESVANKIESMYGTPSGYTEAEIDEAGEILVATLVRALGKQADATRSKVLLASVNRLASFNRESQPDSAHRYPSQSVAPILVTIQSVAPIQASVQTLFEVFVPRNADIESDIQLISKRATFEARPAELLPAPGSMLRLRADVFAERVFQQMLEQLSQQMQR